MTFRPSPNTHKPSFPEKVFGKPEGEPPKPKVLPVMGRKAAQDMASWKALYQSFAQVGQGMAAMSASMSKDLQKLQADMDKLIFRTILGGYNAPSPAHHRLYMNLKRHYNG